MSNVFQLIAPDTSECADMADALRRIERYADDIARAGFPRFAEPLATLTKQFRQCVQRREDDLAEREKDLVDEREAFEKSRRAGEFDALSIAVATDDNRAADLERREKELDEKIVEVNEAVEKVNALAGRVALRDRAMTVRVRR